METCWRWRTRGDFLKWEPCLESDHAISKGTYDPKRIGRFGFSIFAAKETKGAISFASIREDLSIILDRLGYVLDQLASIRSVPNPWHGCYKKPVWKMVLPRGSSRKYLPADIFAGKQFWIYGALKKAIRNRFCLGGFAWNHRLRYIKVFEYRGIG